MRDLYRFLDEKEEGGKAFEQDLFEGFGRRHLGEEWVGMNSGLECGKREEGCCMKSRLLREGEKGPLKG